MSRYTGGGGYLPLNWWLTGATVDLRFTTGQYYDTTAGGEGQAVTTYLSCSRASTAYAQNSAGTWISFGSNILRITDLGLLIEDARTNNLLNSDAPATQTTASLATGSYTLWVNGSGSATPSAGTATITGAGTATDGSPDVFTVTGAGTVVVTVSGSLTRFQLENGAFASSYIPTTGATVTRAQDVVTATSTVSSLWDQAPASCVIDWKFETNTPTAGVSWTVIGDPGGGERSGINVTDLDGTVGSFLPPTLNANIGNSVHSVTGMKAGVSWDSSTSALVGGGGTAGTSTGFSGWSSNSWVSVQLGNEATANHRAYGYFRRLTMWNTKLSNAQLQGFTFP